MIQTLVNNILLSINSFLPSGQFTANLTIFSKCGRRRAGSTDGKSAGPPGSADGGGREVRTGGGRVWGRFGVSGRFEV